ncbi:MAG: methionine adenosyltransferase, partial [Candidatus Dadabacteria bacterium]
HPDKVCDQISDAILDCCISEDPESRVAIEALAKTDVLVLAGEITSKANVDLESVAREVIADIGYTDKGKGFDAETVEIRTHVSQQSLDIKMGVDGNCEKGASLGAGDQGLMFGFACDETDEYMPLPITLAHALVKKLAELRKSGSAPFIKPDSKCQVSVAYEDNRPQRVHTIVLSTQHDEALSLNELKEFVIEEVIKKVVPGELLDGNPRYLINPTGRFVLGGPQADCGLTGRKIIVDTYGGYARHGGGAFSGKDPSKVDRSAAYAARYIAKNIVAAGLATKCEVQLAYAIGVAEPVAIYVDTFNTGKCPNDLLVKSIRESFELTPLGIINSLSLRSPIYRQTATYGHFGRTPTPEGGFSWEKVDKCQILRELVGY